MHVQTDFESFALDERLIRSLREVNILTPTTLQRAAFPPLLEGRDLALQAGPGTGRALAWCLPVLTRLLGAGSGARVVVVVPGGDAAMNVEREIRRVTRHVRVSVLMPASGVERTGASYEMFESGDSLPDILVGTGASLAHFIDGAGFPVDALTALVCDLSQPLDPPSREALEALASRVPQTAQRVVISEGEEAFADRMGATLLRGPAFVMGTAGIADAPAPQPVEEEPAPRSRPVRSRRGKTPHRRGPSDRPEAWPIAHMGVTVVQPPSAADLARVIRVEARGHTVVLVGTADRGAEVERAVSSLLPDATVRFVREDDPLPGDGGDAVTICPSSSRSREDLTANVLILDVFPPTADAYVAHIPIMRCEPGDRIVSIVSPRDVGTQYQLRLSYGIRLLEKRVPTLAQVDTMDQADSVGRLRGLAGKARPRDLELLARVRTMQSADDILACAVAGLLRGGKDPGPASRNEPQAPQAPRDPAPKPSRSRRPKAKAKAKAKPEADTSEPLIRSEPPRLPERGAGRRGGVPMVELRLSCGSDDGVEADFLVQWLQSRLAMRISELGPIKIDRGRTVITVPKERADEARMILGGLTFGARKVEVSQN